MPTDSTTKQAQDRLNILVLCMDQWQTHMDVPADVEFPAMQRMEAEGVSFDRAYCTIAICTPSRSAMWTGVHAVHTGLWDNTNFAWIDELSSEVPTIGHMLREQGYYTAFKGKWHLSQVPPSEDALERFGFSDYQQWGEMFGAPLEGHMVDGTAAFETVDWLETKGTSVDQPWLLISSLVNPHDIMFYQSDPVEEPHPNGLTAGMQSTEQRLGLFEKEWDLSLPDNFEDDLRLQPLGVREYRKNIELNFGRIPEDRDDLWIKRRNYLLNCMRRVDAEFMQILDALDRTGQRENTVIIFVSDHGEMNGAHRMAQKGNIHFDEATVVNLTICAPGGARGESTASIGSLLDLAPTALSFAGMPDEEISERYPQLKGQNLRPVVFDPAQAGSRGSGDEPGSGALICWDCLNSFDTDWALSGALKALADLSGGGTEPDDKSALICAAGKEFGAPDFRMRTFYRAVVDGQYKLVRWFSPLEYGNPSTLDELYATSDVTLHDLVNDPGEMENLGNPDHPDHDPALVERMLAKLHTLVEREIGEDVLLFDLDMFGTREVTYR